MELDAQGRACPTGRTETLEADALVLALGQDVDTELLRRVPGVELQKDGVVKVGPDLMTGHPGIFAGGDMVPSERTVTIAVGHGKKAARAIDAFLRGEQHRPREKARVVGFRDLHVWYSTEADRTVQPHLEGPRRIESFDEIVIDGNEAAAFATMAYRLNEVCAIYPITPSSTMGELGRPVVRRAQAKNVWGTVPPCRDAERRRRGRRVHGALQTGALATTFTASQGLLLMIPNMYKIAGELTPRSSTSPPGPRGAGLVDLRRPPGRHGRAADRLRHALLQLSSRRRTISP
jgi:hypothetical protein